MDNKYLCMREREREREVVLNYGLETSIFNYWSTRYSLYLSTNVTFVLPCILKRKVSLSENLQNESIDVTQND